MRFATGRLSFPRRQQLRRLEHTAAAAAAAVGAVALALLAATASLAVIAAALLLLAVGLGVYARQWARLAGRSGVGARSESQVQHALRTLQREGWRLRHSLPWQGRGDVDHVAIAPTGVAFAIEAKARTYHRGHLATVRDQAGWLQRRRRRWCPGGARPVLCVTHAQHLQRTELDVLVVSIDELAPALRTAAGIAKRPTFLARP